jgi:hypothetical protein
MNHQPGHPVSGKSAPVAPPRHKIDVVIALAVLVLLLALWRLVNRPTVLGAAGSMIVTNVFGPFGVRLAQNLGAGAMEGGSAGQATGSVETAVSTLPTNSATPPALTSNQPPVADGWLAADDVIITNRPFKAIVVSPADFSYTNGSGWGPRRRHPVFTQLEQFQ